MATAMTGGTARLVKTGYKNGNADYPIKLYVYYKTTQDVINNKSTITLGMYFTQKGGSLGPWTDSTSGSYLGVGSTKTTFSGSFSNTTSSTYWLASEKTFTVNHNSDGTGSAKIVWKWNVNSSWGKMVNPSGEFTITLPTIPRKSSVSAKDAYIENESTIKISRKSSSFKHTLQYKISGQSSYSTIISKTDKTEIKWTIPKVAYSFLKDNKVSTTIKCITYSGNTKIGEATTTLTATGKAKSTITIDKTGGATKFYIENTGKIKITRKSASFKHTLQYKISGQSSYTTIKTKTSSTEVDWKIPVAAYNYFKDNKVSITLKCITFMDDVTIGESTTTLIAYGKSASTVKATNISIGGTSTITITRNSSSFKHTLQYKISGQSSYTTIKTKTSDTTTTLKLDSATLYKLIGSKNTKITVTIKCTTYVGDVVIGSSTSTTFTATCSSDECSPTFETSYANNAEKHNSLTGSNSAKIILNYNEIVIKTTNVTARNGATIVEQEIKCADGKTVTSKSSNDLTAKFSNVTKGTFTITITDSRGFSSVETIKKTEIGYTPLSGTIDGKMSATLSNADTEEYSVTLSFTLSGKGSLTNFGSKTNSITYTPYYSSDGKTWIKFSEDFPATVNKVTNNAFSVGQSVTLTKVLTATSPHYVKVTVTDSIKSFTLQKTLLPDPTFYWGKNKFVFNTQVFSNHSMVFSNNKTIYGTTVEDKDNGVKGGIGLGNISSVNSNNNCVIGFGGYDKKIGRTNIYGHHNINLYTHGGIYCNGSLNCNDPLNLPSNYYYDPDTPKHGLNCNNSDIVGVNGIRFNDVSSSSATSSEGIFFPTDDTSGKFDKLVAYGGRLYFGPKSGAHSSLCYVPGDTMKIPDNTSFAGYVSNERKSIFISIPINKPLVGVTTATASGKLEGRGITGYLYNPNCIVLDEGKKQKRSATYDLSKETAEKFTTTCYLANDDKSVIYGCIHFHITFANEIATSSDPNSDAVILNNTPVTVVPDGTLTITFG